MTNSKPGPSRIRVTLSRGLSHAEQEYLRQVSAEIRKQKGDKLNLSGDGRIYAESAASTSRQLFDAVSSVLAFSFVNVFPTAVRTFRELVTKTSEQKVEKLVAPVTLSKEDVQDYLPLKVGDVTYTGKIPVFADPTEIEITVANKKRTKGKKDK